LTAYLRGIWGFPLTPFAGGGIDLDALARAVEHQATGGVDVLCACGAIAQGDLLTSEEWRACVAEIVGASRRIPVVATIPAQLEPGPTAAAAVELGAAALLLLPASGDAVAEAARLQGVAAAAPGVPVVLYHRSPLMLTPDALLALCEIPELQGLKDGHRDARAFRRLRGAACDRLLWLSAWEDVALPFHALGCEAFAPASASYAPAYARAWLSCLEGGDHSGAARLLEAHAYPMVDLRLSRPGIDVGVVKAAMAACGLPAGETRPPAAQLTSAERARVDELVSDLQNLLGAVAS